MESLLNLIADLKSVISSGCGTSDHFCALNNALVKLAVFNALAEGAKKAKADEEARVRAEIEAKARTTAIYEAEKQRKAKAKVERKAKLVARKDRAKTSSWSRGLVLFYRDLEIFVEARKEKGLSFFTSLLIGRVSPLFLNLALSLGAKVGKSLSSAGNGTIETHNGLTKRSSFVNKLKNELKDSLSNKKGMRIVAEIAVVSEAKAKSVTSAKAMAFDTEEINDFNVILKGTTDWNSSLFTLLEKFGISYSPEDIVKVSMDLSSSTRRGFIKAMARIGYHPVAEGIYVSTELWKNIITLSGEVFNNFTEQRGYLKSFITTPALKSCEYMNDLPVFLVSDAVLPWEGNDGAALATVGVLDKVGHQFRYIDRGVFAKGFLARSAYLVKEENGVLSLVNYKDLNLGEKDKRELEEFINDLRYSRGYSIELNGVKYWKGALVTPSTLKGKGKKVDLGADGILKREGLFTIIAKDKQNLKTSNNWQISQLLLALNVTGDDTIDALKDEFFSLLSKGIESKLAKILNQNHLDESPNLLGIMNSLEGEKYAHLVNTFEIKGASKYVNMMSFGAGDVVLGKWSPEERRNFGDKPWLEACLTRTPNQDASSVQLVHLIDYRDAWDAVIEGKLENKYQEIRNVIFGAMNDNEIASFKSFYRAVIAPQLIDDIIWVSTELQAIVTGDNDGDRNILTTNRLWVCIAKLIGFVRDERPTKEQSKKLVIKSSVFSGVKQEKEMKKALEFMEQDDNDSIEDLSMFLTVKNGGQLNVGGITNVAAMATTYFEAERTNGGVRMLEWVRRYFYTCFDVQQAFIDRQKYAYVIPSLKYWHLSRGPISVGNKMMIVPGISYIVMGEDKFRSDKIKFSSEEEVVTWFEQENFMDKEEEMLDMESGMMVKITDENQGYTVKGALVWSQTVLFAFKLAQWTGKAEGDWQEIYEELINGNIKMVEGGGEERDGKEWVRGIATWSSSSCDKMDSYFLVDRKNLLKWLKSASDDCKRPTHMSLVKTHIDAEFNSLFNTKFSTNISSLREVREVVKDNILNSYESSEFLIRLDDNKELTPDSHCRLFSDAFLISQALKARAKENTAQSSRQASVESAREKIAHVASVFKEFEGEGELANWEEAFANRVWKGLLNSQVNQERRALYLNQFENAVKFAAAKYYQNKIVIEEDKKDLFVEFLADCLEAISESAKNSERVDFQNEYFLPFIIEKFNDVKNAFSEEVIAGWRNEFKLSMIQLLLDDKNANLSHELKAQKDERWSDVESCLTFIDRLEMGMKFFGKEQVEKIKGLVIKEIKVWGGREWISEKALNPRANFNFAWEFWAEIIGGLLLCGTNLSIKLEKVVSAVEGRIKRSEEWVQYFSLMTKHLQRQGIEIQKYIALDLNFGFGQIISLNQINKVVGTPDDGVFIEYGDKEVTSKKRMFKLSCVDMKNQDYASYELLKGSDLLRALDLIHSVSFELKTKSTKKYRGEDMEYDRAVFVPYCFLLENMFEKKRRENKGFNMVQLFRKAAHDSLGIPMNAPLQGSDNFDEILNNLYPHSVQLLAAQIFGQPIAFGRNDNYRPDSGYSQTYKKAEKVTEYQKFKASTAYSPFEQSIVYHKSVSMAQMYTTAIDLAGLEAGIYILNFLGLNSRFLTNLEIGLGIKKWNGMDPAIVDNCMKGLINKSGSKELRACLSLIHYKKYGNESLVNSPFAFYFTRPSLKLEFTEEGSL